MHPEINPNEANEPSEMIFTPPHNAIIHNKIPVNPAVLKLGCLRIKKINNTKLNIENNFLSFFTKRQCANKFDASRIKKGFINSDGCRRKLPRTNHLEDPLTVIPFMFVSNIRKIKK